MKLFCLDQQEAKSWHSRAYLAVDLLIKSRPITHGKLLTVLDIGCGDQKLRKALVSRSLLHNYYCCDILPQLDSIPRFDISKNEIVGHYDVIFLLGVIEYLSSPGAALMKIFAHCNRCIVSNVSSSYSSYSKKELNERGWKTFLSETEMKSLIQSAGFQVHHRVVSDSKTIIWHLAR